MNIIFKEEALSELYVTGKTNDKKYKKLCKNKRLIDGYVRVINTLYNVESTEELKVFSPSLTPIVVESRCYFTFEVLAMNSVSYKFLFF